MAEMMQIEEMYWRDKASEALNAGGTGRWRDRSYNLNYEEVEGILGQTTYLIQLWILSNKLCETRKYDTCESCISTKVGLATALCGALSDYDITERLVDSQGIYW